MTLYEIALSNIDIFVRSNQRKITKKNRLKEIFLVRLTLIAAAVGYAEPYNFNHTSCIAVQKSLAFSASGLYISKISRPAENTVGDDLFFFNRKEVRK